jgi:hypothetical protein
LENADLDEAMGTPYQNPDENLEHFFSILAVHYH